MSHRSASKHCRHLHKYRTQQQQVLVWNSVSRLVSHHFSLHRHPRTNCNRNQTQRTHRNAVVLLANCSFHSLLSNDFCRGSFDTCRRSVENPPMQACNGSSSRCSNEPERSLTSTPATLFPSLSLITTAWSVLILLALNTSGSGSLLLSNGRIRFPTTRRIVSSSCRSFGGSTLVPAWGGLVIPTMSSYSMLFAEAFHPSASQSAKSNDENDANQTEDNDDNESTCEASDNGNDDEEDDLIPEGTPHPEDDKLWLYHYESTNSTQDQAKRIVEHLSSLDSPPSAFCVTASMQTKGRGTSGRHWLGAPGNVFVTMGIPMQTWMTTLLRERKIPLTLLPLTIGTLVAELVQSELDDCGAKTAVVTAKWPNDVLVDGNKISGTLIESSGDWFLIGIGINVAHAPSVPTIGTDYGRPAVSLREYGCGSEDASDDHKSSRARGLGVELALGFHRWMRANTEDNGSAANANHRRATAESIVEGWTRWLDRDAEWTIRNDGQATPGRPKVVELLDVLPDGRIRVRNKDTGVVEILVSDYFV